MHGRLVLAKLELIRETKKADAAESKNGLNHVGLLFNEPPGNSRLFFK
jgi:hypothetical protein